MKLLASSKNWAVLFQKWSYLCLYISFLPLLVCEIMINTLPARDLKNLTQLVAFWQQIKRLTPPPIRSTWELQRNSYLTHLAPCEEHTVLPIIWIKCRKYIPIIYKFSFMWTFGYYYRVNIMYFLLSSLLILSFLFIASPWYVRMREELLLYIYIYIHSKDKPTNPLVS